MQVVTREHAPLGGLHAPREEHVGVKVARLQRKELGVRSRQRLDGSNEAKLVARGQLDGERLLGDVHTCEQETHNNNNNNKIIHSLAFDPHTASRMMLKYSLKLRFSMAALSRGKAAARRAASS